MKAAKIPSEIKKALIIQRKAHKDHKHALKTNHNIEFTRNNLANAKKSCRFMIRRQNHKEDLNQDSQLHSIFTNPSVLYRSIKSSKRSLAGAVPFLTVGDKKYVGANVADGLYDSISSLKYQDLASLQTSPNYITAGLKTTNIFLNFVKTSATSHKFQLTSPQEYFWKWRPMLMTFGQSPLSIL